MKKNNEKIITDLSKNISIIENVYDTLHHGAMGKALIRRKREHQVATIVHNLGAAIDNLRDLMLDIEDEN
jgi:hypothetical protein